MKASWMMGLVAAGALALGGCDDDAPTTEGTEDGGALDGGAGDGSTAEDSSAEEDSSTEEDASAAEPSWEGADLHLTVSGTIGGQPVEISGTTDGFCERNYIVPALGDTTDWATAGFLEKIEVKLEPFDYEGSPAEFGIEFAALDFPNVTTPLAGLVVGGADADATNLTDVNINAQLKVNPDTADEEEFEQDGVTGTFDLHVLSGTVGSDGLTIPDDEGQFGGLLQVELSGNDLPASELTMSFTVDCGENDLEEPEE